MGKILGTNYGGIGCYSITDSVIEAYLSRALDGGTTKKLDIHFRNCGSCGERFVTLLLPPESAAERAGEERAIRILDHEGRPGSRSLAEITEDWVRPNFTNREDL